MQTSREYQLAIRARKIAQLSREMYQIDPEASEDLGQSITSITDMFEQFAGPEQPAPARFADSTEATEFVEQLQKMLADPRLAHWCKETDYNFCTNVASQLTEAKNAVDWLISNLDEAC